LLNILYNISLSIICLSIISNFYELYIITLDYIFNYFWLLLMFFKD